MLRATLNEPVLLSSQLSDGETTLYPRVKLYNTVGAVVHTAGLSHVENGLYSITYTPVTEGFYTAVYQVFSDAGFTTAAGEYDIEAETIEVNSDKTNITRILGLVHENSVVDMQQYDTDGNLTDARIRAYNSSANAQAAGTTGLLFTWVVEATYENGKLSKYQILRS